MNIKDREYAVAVCKTTEHDRFNRQNKYHVIKNNFFSWAADPFPIEYNGELYIFAEIFLYSKAKGTIGYCKLTEGGFTKWKKVIEEPYHLSFPNLFWDNNMLYMCPESHEDNTLYLYRCVSFPDKWVKDKVVAQGDFNDTIFYFQKDGKYIVTYSLDRRLHILKENNGMLEDRDVSDYVSDIDAARPAGKIFSAGGMDIIPVQIGKPLYGSGLAFKEFNLNWPEYSEHELYRMTAKDIKIDKKRQYIGLHTFNFSENYTVIDLVWEEVLVQRLLYRFFRKIKKSINKVRLKNHE